MREIDAGIVKENIDAGIVKEIDVAGIVCRKRKK